MRLLSVPRTAAGRTEPSHHLHQVEQALAAAAGWDRTLGNVLVPVAGHGETTDVGVGVGAAVGVPVSVLRIAITCCSDASQRPYRGFTWIEASASCLCSQSWNAVP